MTYEPPLQSPWRRAETRSTHCYLSGSVQVLGVDPDACGYRRDANLTPGVSWIQQLLGFVSNTNINMRFSRRTPF